MHRKSHLSKQSSFLYNCISNRIVILSKRKLPLSVPEGDLLLLSSENNSFGCIALRFRMKIHKTEYGKHKIGLVPLSLWLAALLAFSSGVAFAQPGQSSAERMLLDAVNAERRAQGVPPLMWDDALAAAARSHAAQMARHDTVTHVVPGEPALPSRAARAGARFSWISENVVSAASVPNAHAQFMKSPAHRANILDMDMDRIGIGIVERGNQVFVVEDFAKGK